MTEIIAVIGILIAMASAIFAYLQAKSAKHSLHQAYLLKLFSSFDSASESTIADPELLYSVHGLDRNVPIEEAKSIAYLSLLLDAFQHYYGEQYNGDFKKMTEAMKKQSTFLNRILAVPENYQRWQTLKQLYYGEFDRSFTEAVESLIATNKNENGA